VRLKENHDGASRPDLQPWYGERSELEPVLLLGHDELRGRPDCSSRDGALARAARAIFYILDAAATATAPRR